MKKVSSETLNILKYILIKLFQNLVVKYTSCFSSFCYEFHKWILTTPRLKVMMLPSFSMTVMFHPAFNFRNSDVPHPVGIWEHYFLTALLILIFAQRFVNYKDYFSNKSAGEYKCVNQELFKWFLELVTTN